MPVIFMERSLLDSLTEADIKEIIDENEGHTKYARLEGYYEGDHDILRHTKKDSTAPNNRLVNNMAKYITDTATGYFIGKPVVYSSQNDAYLETLQDIFDYNDEQDENMELAKGASINGDCFEMLYMDEDAQIRFTKVPPDGCIYICETGYNTPMAAIRIVYSKDKDKNIIKKVEFWTAQDCWYFRSINGGALELLDIREHYWGDVPFVEYINNEERLGDFEGVITLIDAYNRVESNTANFFQYNDEALLKVLKMGAVTSQDIAEMKEKGAIILEDGGDIQWLIKEVSDTALENYKKRLREDMHIFSAVPNLTDANFGGNLSGVAVSYKLWGLEQICAIKERKFKRGLQRRIQRGIGLGFHVAKIDEKLIQRVLSFPWSEKHYSEAVWGACDHLSALAKREITMGFIQGSSVQKMAKAINDVMDKGRYNAERLVRTECKYFANQGEVMGYKETGIEEYQFLGGTEHSGSCTCSELNGRVFRVDEAEPGVNLPPIHPNCLCIIRAYFKKSVFAKREGNPLDGNIKFEEWKKKYAS